MRQCLACRGVRLTHAELVRLSLPLVEPFRTAHGVTAERDVLLVRVIGPDVEGWGECVAEAVPSYSSEYVNEAQDVIRRFLVNGIDVPGHPMAKAALEAALLDALCRSKEQSLASYLGAVRDRVPAGVAVGMHSSIGALLDTVERYLEEGYVRVKLKIAPG